MGVRLSKLTDQQLAQILGALNDGTDSMRTRLMVEISFRLARANGPGMDYDSEALAAELLNANFRLREYKRGQRRKRLAKQLGEKKQPIDRKPARPASLVLIR
jgi:hypothetical protein